MKKYIMKNSIAKENIAKECGWKLMLAFVFYSFLLLSGIPALPAEAAGALLPTAVDNLDVGLRSSSELVVTDSGYMRVFYNGMLIGIEDYDDNFNLLSKRSLAMELDIWGGFYAGTDAYYLVEGRNNPEESDTAEVIRVIKYDRGWNRLGAAAITGNPALFGGEVRYPFDYGCVEMTERNGILYVVTGHEGYVDASVGQGHQGFLMIAVNEASMTGQIVDCDLWHSFAQYISARDSDLYVLEQSEGSRFTKLTRYNADSMERTSVPVLQYGGTRTSAWAVSCYASVDGMALSAGNVLCLGTSIDQSQYDNVSADTAHNIYLTVTPIADFSGNATKVKWLTNYSGGGKSFLGTKITKINDNRFMISWEEYEEEGTASADDSLSASVLHYVFVDGNGDKISGEFTQTTPISDCQPVVKGSKIVYYASNANMVDFYSIDAENGAAGKKTYRVAGENATWDFAGGVLTISGTGAISLDTEAHPRYPVSSVRGAYVYYSSDNVWKPLRDQVKKIVIKSGITAIPERAFAYFDSLEEVEIENGLQSIGAEAFYGCDRLSEIRIPSTVTSIGKDFLWTGSYWTSDNSHVVRAAILAPYDSYAVRYAREYDIGYRLSLLEAAVSGLKESYKYTGKKQKPAVTLTLGGRTLEEDTDYSIKYTDNVDKGTATITVTGKWDYTDTLELHFRITAAQIKKCKIGSIAKQTYSGSAVKPAVTVKNGSVTLKKGTDYKVSYSNNKKEGTGKVKITGIGNYTGSVTKSFKIAAAPVSPAKGTTLKDTKKGAYYKITKKGFSGKAQAEYVKPLGVKKSMTIPATIKVKNITYKVTSVAAKAFANSAAIQKLVIGKNIASIGKQAFFNCKNLKAIQINTDTLVSARVGANAFKGINSKAAVRVPAAKLSAYRKILKAKGIGSKVKVTK